MSKRVGFIGLGIMGQPMAANLLKHGYELTVWNRTIAKAATLLAAGAAEAPTVKALAEEADTIVLMLTGPAAIDAILDGPHGLLAGPLVGKCIINMSTVAPTYNEALAKRLHQYGAELIDAPVSGSKKPAEEGTLVILAGGDKERINTVEPLLLAMGKKVVHCGEIGKGSAMKMAINLLLGTMMAGLAEAVHFGEKAGLDTATLLDTILAGPLGCGLFQLKRDMLIANDYPPQFPFRHMAKDLGFIRETAVLNGGAIPLATLLASLYDSKREELQGLDFAAIKKVLESL